MKNKILKIFIQPGCPACPAAKELGERLKKKITVSFIDVSKEEGLKEALKYDVLVTPTLILIDEKGEIKKKWSGRPEEKEVLSFVDK